MDTDLMIARHHPMIALVFFMALAASVGAYPQDSPAKPKHTIAFVPYSLVPDIPHSGGGGNTSVTFDNQLTVTIKLWWVDGGGGRHGYGEVPAGKTKTQGSYAQHVWLITNTDDKPLGYFVASSAAATARVTPNDL